MIRKIFITVLVNFSILISLYGQQANTYLEALKKNDTIQVSDIKTTHLLFDQKISYLDLGSPYFVADTTKQMIRLKHIGEELSDIRSQISNLTVITEDGGYYSILLGFNRFVPDLTYRVKRSVEFIHGVQQDAQIKVDKELALQNLCFELRRNFNNKINITHEKPDDLKIRITGIFYVQEKIGLRVELTNYSTIDFDIDHILFRTKLKKRIAKDYLYQERVIHPIKVCTDNYEVAGHGLRSINLLFDKFMLNENEKLSVDIFESNGGRSISVDIPREELLNPKLI